MNDQIDLPYQSLCVVHGIRQLLPQQSITDLKYKAQKQTTPPTTYYNQQSLSQYVIDKASKEVLPFNVIKNVAKQFQLDICLMQQPTDSQQMSQEMQNPSTQPKVILSLQKLKQSIYRQYYLKQLKSTTFYDYVNEKKQINKQQHVNQDDQEDQLSLLKNHKGRVKTIRLGQNIHQKDIQNKVNKVQRWKDHGERLFKIMTLNDTAKAQKIIKTFCLKFGKQVEVVQQIYQPNPRKRPIIRLVGVLQFQQQIQIDPEFINKRYRRKLLYKENQQNKKPLKQQNYMQNQPFQIQKQYIQSFRQAGIPYPKQFQYLEKTQKSLNKGQANFIYETINQIDQQQLLKKEQAQQQDERLTQKQIHQRQVLNRKNMGIRTVQDIVQQMQQLKGRQYQMQSYEQDRFKELQKQLKQKLKQARKRHQKQGINKNK